MSMKKELANKAVILVVDDSKYIRSILKDFLEKNEYIVIEAENGKEAVSKCHDMNPDLILIDYLMPKMDGITAVKTLRESLRYKGVPIVMITSLEDEESINYVFEAGATDYISKPINFALLKHRVNNLMKTRNMEISSFENERYAQSIIKNALDGIIVINKYGIIKTFNPSAEEMFGFEAEKIINKNISLIIPNLECDQCGNYSDLENILDDLDKKSEMKKSLILTGLTKEGLKITLELTVSGLTLRNNLYYAVILRDITIKQKHENKIKYQAFYDSTTGIPNRFLLKKRLEREINYCKNASAQLALVYLDLDKFKLINDSLGHSVGDKLLRLVSDRLNEALHSSDTVARMGGDEFAILLPNIREGLHAVNIASRVLNAIREPFFIEGYELFVTASLGISFCPTDGSNVDSLIKNADMAMYSAKENGGNTFEVYTSEMNDNAFERLEMESRLRVALENKEFVIYYQPKIDAQSKKIIGFEALLRWNHPSLGLIPPMDFIPLAEETGLIVSIGKWVLEESCLQAKQWQDQGFGDLHVSVNLSSKQFQLQNLAHTISRALELSGLEAKFLELEITESVVMDDVQHTMLVINNIREKGVRFSIDDFGTGYSSLSYLQKFSINKLKIDKSFVEEIGLDKDDGLIVSTIITLAKSLNMKIVAEGVETREQYEFLKKGMCDEVQGFFFGRPKPAQEFKEMFLEKLNLEG